MSELWVGADEEFTTLRDAIAASGSGDTILVRAGVYENDFSAISHDLTIVGVDGMAHLLATGPIGNRKAILITRADITLENIEFSGASVPDRNGAGIRYEGGDLTIRNSYFHDNENGVLAASDPDGQIRIEGSEFARNGYGDGRSHGIYINEVQSLVVTDSYFHDTSVGHHIKSRALETQVLNSTLDDAAGNSSYSIDLPNGGVGLIEGNTLIQGGSSALNKTMVSYGAEGNLKAVSELLVEGNVFVSHRSSTIGIRNPTDVTVEIAGNKFYHVSQIASGPADLDGNVSSNEVPADEDIPRPGVDDSSGEPVDETAEMPSLAVIDAVGDEDSEVPLTIEAALADADGSEALSIVVSGVPDGASLNGGVEEGVGLWRLAPEDLPGLKLVPPADASGEIALTVTASATETNGGDLAVVSETLSIILKGVADQPSLSVSDMTGNEDAPIELPIDAALADGDGSEQLHVVVSGVPEAASLSAGTDEGGGVWRLTAGQLDGLTFIPPVNASGTIALSVTAIATEEVGGDSRGASRALNIHIEGVADAPTLAVADAEGFAGQSIPLAIAASLVDDDGSETLGILISGISDGASLSAGVPGTAGAWQLTPADLPGLSYLSAPGDREPTTLSVTAIATEADGGVAETVASFDVTLKDPDQGAVLVGTSDTDTLIGGDLDDTLRGAAGNDLLIGLGGDDVFAVHGSSDGYDRYYGGEGFDRLIAESAGTVIGLASFANGVETIDGSGHAGVTIQGDDSAPVLLDFSKTTLADIALVEGGLMNDTIVASDGSSMVLDPLSGDDLVMAGAADLTVLYSGIDGGFDILANGSGRSTLRAESDGTVIGLASYVNGADVIDGAGHAGVTIRGSEAAPGLMDFGETTLIDIARVEGGRHADAFIASDRSAMILDPMGGDDMIMARSADLTVVYSGFDSGYDFFVNGSGTTTIRAESTGTMIGLASYANGVDVIDGSGHAGVTVRIDDAAPGMMDFSDTTLTDVALVQGGQSNDTVVASDASDMVLDLGGGDDLVLAGSADLTLLYSGSDGGHDVLVDGSGRSTIMADGAGTVIGLTWYVNGVDEIDGSGHAGVTIRGTEAVTGPMDFSKTTLTDIVLIAGGEQDDTIIGSMGDDVLQGGLGSDRFVFQGYFGNDRLVDFASGDDVVEMRQAEGGIDGFGDLDTNGDGVLDAGDTRVTIVDDGTVIDFSLGTLTVEGRTGLVSGDFDFVLAGAPSIGGFLIDSDSGLLSVDGGGRSLDLTEINFDALPSLSSVDLTGNGVNTLVVDEGAVFGASADHRLIIRGDDDRVEVDDTWTLAGKETIEGESYSVYSRGESELVVSDNVNGGTGIG